MKKVFTEIGFGNGSFISSEIEDGNMEYRVNNFVVPEKIDDFYIRIWLSRFNFILSTKEGFKMKRRDRSELKLLIGVGGYNT